jgi:hypothetical protein
MPDIIKMMEMPIAEFEYRNRRVLAYYNPYKKAERKELNGLKQLGEKNE